MLYRCYNKCPHYVGPCEFSTAENDICIKDLCPIGEDNDYFCEVNEQNEFFCLVVGSRNFSDYELFCKKMDIVLSRKLEKEITIVSGGAKGADAFAEKYAKERGYRILVFPADWNGEGKAAGYKRNMRMHEFVSTKKERGVIAFWDGKSSGTAHSFELAKHYKNQLKIIRFNG